MYNHFNGDHIGGQTCSWEPGVINHPPLIAGAGW
jgi:hypothetical protein